MLSVINQRMLDRRAFLAGLIAFGSEVRKGIPLAPNASEVKLTLASCVLEIAPNRYVPTTAYSEHLPGSVLRLPAHRPIAISISNATTMSDFVHWHGLQVPATFDGTPEEDSLGVNPGERLRYILPPQQPGLGFAHSHAMSGHGFTCGPYSGQFLPLAIGDFTGPVPFDREIFLTSHEWMPTLTDTAGEQRSLEEMQHLRIDLDSEEDDDEADGGWEIVYKAATINGKVLGAGEPVRVQQGERILFRVINASATEPLCLSLPGHRFLVLALDGYPVPTPQFVEQLELGVGERIEALVIMDVPGVWILGSSDDGMRALGMGIVIEYAHRTGDPVWSAPTNPVWDYTRFTALHPSSSPPVQRKHFRLERRHVTVDGFEQWEMVSPPGEDNIFQTRERARVTLVNNTDEPHPMHLHRLPFELVSVAGIACAGIRKDTVVVPPFQDVELDFSPADSGPALLHCHNQMHMDCGLKTLLHFQ